MNEELYKLQSELDAIAEGEYLEIGEDLSIRLDGFFTAEQLKRIAAKVEEFKGGA